MIFIGRGPEVNQRILTCPARRDLDHCCSVEVAGAPTTPRILGSETALFYYRDPLDQSVWYTCASKGMRACGVSWTDYTRLAMGLTSSVFRSSALVLRVPEQCPYSFCLD